MLVFLEGGAELSGLGVDGKLVIAGDARGAFLEAANRLGDLFGSFEPAGADPPSELVAIGEQTRFRRGVDGAVFVGALFAAAQDIGCRRRSGS
jgi:hypothetical protein